MKKKITAYKGFDKDLKCRGFQYEIGKTYIHDGDVEMCRSGFHACEYPLDVFSYYDPAASRFAVVETIGLEHSDGCGDSKIVSASVSIKEEIDLFEMVTHAVDWIMGKVDESVSENERQSAATNTGARSAATNTGYQSAATNTGDWSAASVSGVNSIALSSGYRGKARAGESGAIVLCWRGDNGEIVRIKSSKVGENGIKPDIFYTLNSNGKFIEVTE